MPLWLLSLWNRTVHEAGSTASDDAIEATGLALLNRWSDPRRKYHTLKHLADVIAHCEELTPAAHTPVLISLAAFYHGAMFNPAGMHTFDKQGGEDAIASAELAYHELRELGVPEDNASRVRDLVSATVRHKPIPGDADSAVLCDADMSILAAEPQRYKNYILSVYEEYENVPTEAFLRARVIILEHLLERPSLYSTIGAEAWEEPARQNLSAELHKAKDKLAKVEAGENIDCFGKPVEPAPDVAAS